MKTKEEINEKRKESQLKTKTMNELEENEYIKKKESSIKFLKIFNIISLGLMLYILIAGFPYYILVFLILNIFLGLASIQIYRREIEVFKLKKEKTRKELDVDAMHRAFNQQQHQELQIPIV